MNRNILFESTPRGNVIVYYNIDDKEFHYYSDYNIPFYVIDSILQKYVVTFHCSHLYSTTKCIANNKNKSTSDTISHSNDPVSKTTNTSTIKASNLKKTHSNVYAKLKKVSNSNSNTNSDTNTNTNVNDPLKQKLHQTAKSKGALKTTKDKTNTKEPEEFIIYHKLKHCGKLRDFDFISFSSNMNHKEIKQKASEFHSNETKKISYKDFMNNNV